MSKRIEHIDSVKGFAIFVVVVGHVIANFFESWSNTLIETPVALYWWRLIYTIHMPLMMFMSGFLFLSSRVQKNPVLKVWWHKVSPLLIPFFTMGAVIYLLKNQMNLRGRKLFTRRVLIDLGLIND